MKTDKTIECDGEWKNIDTVWDGQPMKFLFECQECKMAIISDCAPIGSLHYCPTPTPSGDGLREITQEEWELLQKKTRNDPPDDSEFGYVAGWNAAVNRIKSMLVKK